MNLPQLSWYPLLTLLLARMKPRQNNVIRAHLLTNNNACAYNETARRNHQIWDSQQRVKVHKRIRIH